MARTDRTSTGMLERGRAPAMAAARRSFSARVEEPNRRPLTPTEGDLIGKLVELLMLAGVSVANLQEQFTAAMTRAKRQHTRPVNRAARLPWWVYGRVLSVWHQAPEFTDEKGAPRPLQLKSGRSSFRRLVTRALPDHDAKEILSALQELRVVRRMGATIVPNARALVVKQKTYMTLQRAVQMLDALVSTMRFNLVQSRATKPGRGLFERSAFSEQFDMRHLRDLDALVRVHGQSLLEFFDSWLAKHETATQRSANRAGYVGVGIYVFADDAREEPPKHSTTKRGRS